MHTFAESDSELSARPASDELAVRASAGLRWGAFNQGTQQVVRLAVQVVLTRLLAPEDFGAYMRKDIAKWSEVVKAHHLEMND